MRPRFQAGQIIHKGPNWVLRYWEDRSGADGVVKRVRTVAPLAPYSQHPYRGTATDLDRLREIFQEKISALLAPVNRDSPTAKSMLTLGEFIQHSYFPRLDWRFERFPLATNCISNRQPSKGIKISGMFTLRTIPLSQRSLCVISHCATGNGFLKALLAGEVVTSNPICE